MEAGLVKTNRSWRGCSRRSGRFEGSWARAPTAARASARSRDVLGFARAFGAGHLLQLLLAHGFGHRFGRALELGFRRVAALGRQGGAGGFLLGLGLGGHRDLPGFCPRTPAGPARFRLYRTGRLDARRKSARLAAGWRETSCASSLWFRPSRPFRWPPAGKAERRATARAEAA